MSYAQRIYLTNPVYGMFAAGVVEELRNPQEGIAEPVIVLEAQGQQAAAHLHVIWSEWGQLTRLERSEVALEAYNEAKGVSSARNPRVALGLTPEESARMGIEYAPLEPAA